MLKLQENLGRFLYPSMWWVVFFSMFAPSNLNAQGNASSTNFEKPIETSKNVEEHILESVRNFFVSLSQKQQGDNGLKKALETNDKLYTKTHLTRVSTPGFYENSTKENERNKSLKLHLQSDGGRTFGEQVVANSEILQKLQNGLKLDIDLGSLTQKKSVGNNSTPIKYGLVLKEIIPAQPGETSAAIGRIKDHDLQNYSSHSEAIWTIAPLNEDSSKTIGSNLEQETNHESFSEKVWNQTKTRIPKAQFTGSLKPEFQSGSLPKMRLSLLQKEGFYEYSILAGSKDPNQNYHLFKLPIFQNMYASRKTDSALNPIQSSLNNILLNPNSPSVHLHFYDKERRYGAEAHISNFAGFNLAVKADTPTAWKPKSSQIFGQKGERYEINLARNF